MLQTFVHRIAFAEHREVMLHTFLQRFTNRHRIFTRAGVVPAVEAIQRAFDIGFAGVAQRALLGNGFLQMQAAARPKTTVSSSELPPRRLAPWTDTQAISPTANRPGITTSSPFSFTVNARR